MTERLRSPRKSIFNRAELFDPVHLVLGDDRGVARVGPRLGLALHRQVLGERLVGDDDGGGVDAVLAPEPLEALRHVDDELRVRLLLVHLAKLGGSHETVLVAFHALEAGPQGRVTAHDERWHGLGDPVAEGVGKARAPERRRELPPGP